MGAWLWKWMKRAALLLSLGLAGLLAWAWLAEPAPDIASAVATLAPAERKALQQIAHDGGFELRAMHSLGGYYRGLLEAEVNRRAVWIEGGHVRALRVADWPHAAAPDLSAFTALRVLWLDHGQLAQWPRLSGLDALRELNLSQQPLPTPAANALPAGLETLALAGTRIDAVAPLARLSRLRELDLSATPLTEFDGLLALDLDRLDLSATRIGRMPKALPRPGGDWALNLDDTPVLNPPGLSWQGPGSYAFTGSAFGREERSGWAGSGEVDASGYGETVSALRPVELLTRNDRGVYEVEVEAGIGSGRVRIWLQPPDHYWSRISPWFAAVPVRGFGFPPRQAWVYADVDAGRSARLRGRLGSAGAAERPQVRFLVEPLDGVPAGDFRYHVRHAAVEARP